MAQIYKRSGKWSARIQFTDNAGNRHSKSRAGFPTKVLAKKWAVDQEALLNQGIAINKSISFTRYYKNWVKDYKEKNVAEVTFNRYQYTGEALEDFFHDMNIKDINRQQYQKFINHYGATHAPVTVKKVNSIIRSCVKSAILDDYLTKDFTQRVELTSNHDRIRQVEYLNLDEIHRLLTAATKNIERRPGFTGRYMIVTAIYTGMRLSEIQALTWNDIDFIHSTITINKSWDMNTRSFKPTKNDSSRRTIGINPKLLRLLRILRGHSSSNLVFMNQYGTIPTSNAVNKTLRSLLEALNINRSGFHFHSLRHSHVALLLAHGVDIYTISKRLGHSSVATTSNVYAYLIDEYKDQIDKQIASILEQI